MRYVNVGSEVMFKQERAKVLEKIENNGKAYLLLKTKEGTRSVPALDVMWNGNVSFVTPDGCRTADNLIVVEKISKDLKDESDLVRWLKEEASHYRDKDLGFIVKEIISRF